MREGLARVSAAAQMAVGRLLNRKPDYWPTSAVGLVSRSVARPNGCAQLYRR
jgi:hypothetical protein